MNPFSGTGRLVRLALRRDRIVIPITLLLFLLMAGASVPALVNSYPDYETQVGYISSSAPSTVGRIFSGTVQGVNIGSILMAEIFLFSAVILAIMSIFIVTRHTRYNEEIGAGELIGSTVVGRSAPLTAALLVAIGANLLAGVLVFGIYVAFPELDKTGSLFFAMALASVGIFFAGVAAITSQLSDFRRGANGLAIAALVAAFLVRGLGDALGKMSPDFVVTASWISWLSPLGWGYQVLPYAQNRVMPLLLLLGGFILCIAVAYFLMYRRDIGSSIFQSKSGPARATPKLLKPNGLTIRLQRGNFISWSIGFAIAGLMMGVIINDYRETFENNESFQTFLSASGSASNFTETVFASMFPIMAAMLAGFVVGALSKTYDEEATGRLENLIATPLSKVKWLLSHIGFILIGIIVGLTLMGLVGGIGYVLVAENPETTLIDVVISAIVNVPASALFMSVILLVFAARGKFIKLFAWSFYAYCVLIASLATIFEWPQWTSNFSPFTHTPAAPAPTINTEPLLIMTLLSIGLIILSLLLFRTRDLSLK